MTEREAINVIKSLNFCGLCTTGPCGNCGRKLAKDAALTALEEIQQYRAIGTLEECGEAVEKQEAKKVVVDVDFMIGRDDDGEPIWSADYACPECGQGVAEEYACCPYCGQALDWSGD